MVSFLSSRIMIFKQHMKYVSVIFKFTKFWHYSVVEG